MENKRVLIRGRCGGRRWGDGVKEFKIADM
jgi:hypothetical protein